MNKRKEKMIELAKPRNPEGKQDVRRKYHPSSKLSYFAKIKPTDDQDED